MTGKLKNAWLSLWHELDGLALLRAVLAPGNDLKVAVSSSFGAESAVLLDLVAQVDRATPVLTVDTGQLFPETNAYRERLVDHFGLSDVRVLEPAPALLDSTDPDGDLHQSDPDLCCQVRKVMPHADAASDFDVLITGRKRFHGGTRELLPSVHAEGPHLKVNPLASWSADDIEAAFQTRNLPRHPLVAAGYSSLGCAVCTRRTQDGENTRAGRWAGRQKNECGLHAISFEVPKKLTQFTAQENGS